MTGHGTEEAAVQAIRLGANDYLNKPLRINEIRHVLRKCLGQVATLRSEQELIHSLVHHSIRLSLPSILQIVPSASNYLVNQCVGLIHTEDIPGLRLGLHELLINAIEHGNLGISYEDKSLALQNGVDSLRALYEERLQDPRIRARRVTVDFLYNGAVLQWVIIDEGNGFDFQKLRDPFDEQNVEAQHGRGVYLSRLQFDDFRFEGSGNTVKVSKMVTFPGDRAKPARPIPQSDEIARFT
jgi:anti-sigma regulatory factor (Ser/Thr protein kinase)